MILRWTRYALVIVSLCCVGCGGGSGAADPAASTSPLQSPPAAPLQPLATK
jgi:hypothetical protein